MLGGWSGRLMFTWLKQCRFGHNVLTTCSYCHSYGDFALYAFPGPLLEYVREIAFVGVRPIHPEAEKNIYTMKG